MPSFELNREIVQKAESYGVDFALSMIKLRGFGGKTEFWDHNLEVLHPHGRPGRGDRADQALRLDRDADDAAGDRRAHGITIDSICHGRFGINIVSGWAKAEYEQMGLWPGDEHFRKRYDYSTEYVDVLRELWETGAPTSRASTSRWTTAG